MTHNFGGFYDDWPERLDCGTGIGLSIGCYYFFVQIIIYNIYNYKFIGFLRKTWHDLCICIGVGRKGR